MIIRIYRNSNGASRHRVTTHREFKFTVPDYGDSEDELAAV